MPRITDGCCVSVRKDAFAARMPIEKMNFYGFQKMTLLDFPGKVACTVFTGGCNFRCPFCHNAQLVKTDDMPEIIPEEEILSYLKKRQGLLEGICVTGGEPLLWETLPAFLKKVKELGYAVKLDTNGSFPDRLEQAAGDGLIDMVAMDIKNSPERYAETIGLARIDLGELEKSIRFLLRGTIPYEFRTTVAREFHTEEDIRAAAKWITGADRYYLQCFTDSGNILGGEGILHPYSGEEMKKLCDAAREYVPSTQLRGI